MWHTGVCEDRDEGMTSLMKVLDEVSVDLKDEVYVDVEDEVESDADFESRDFDFH